MNTSHCSDHTEEQRRAADRHCPVCAVNNLERVRQELACLRWDIEAYRGALGYPVPGSHTGKLTDGTTPQCGSCNSEYQKSLEERAEEAEAERDGMAQSAQALIRENDAYRKTHQQLLADAEKAEAQVAYEQERNANNVAMYSEQLRKAEAACAEMREALQSVWDEDEMAWIKIDDGSGHSECGKCGAILPHGGHTPDCLQGKIHHALSTDCGKGWRSPGEYAALEAKCSELRDIAECGWGVIANAGGGDWTKETQEWRDTAYRFRDKYHLSLCDLFKQKETP